MTTIKTMNETALSHKIRCLATLREGQTTCPFCGSIFVWNQQRCRFSNESKYRFAYRTVLYCKNCDLHFGTRNQVTQFNAYAKKNGMGKVSAFPIANMSASEVRQVMYGTEPRAEGEEECAPSQKGGSGWNKDEVIRDKARVPHGKIKPMPDYLYKPRDAELFSKHGVPASTLGIVCFTEIGKKDEEVFVLVENPSDQDSMRNVFWIGREISGAIIDTLARNRREIRYRSFRYYINWYTGQKLKDRITTRYAGYRKLRELEKNTRDLVDVQIYRGKRPCIDHPDVTEILKVHVFGIRSPEAHPIYVYFCPICNEYYVNYDEYLKFCRQYGIPPFRLYDDISMRGTGENYYDSLRVQSTLNLYGYNVNENNGFTMTERQNILADLIDAKLMGQAEICSCIEGIMRLHKNNPNSFFAMKKWEQDLVFARAYKQDESRVVWGKFVPGRGKGFFPPLGE